MQRMAALRADFGSNVVPLNPKKRRRVAIAVPAHNEEHWVGPCIEHLVGLPPDPRIEPPVICVVANNCSDRTADVARSVARQHPCRIETHEIAFEPVHRNAGHARKVAFDAAAAHVRHAGDVLLCTDADTRVSAGWLTRTLDYLDAGYDAVAGIAYLDPAELRALDRRHRTRLTRLRLYCNALDYLRTLAVDDEPWPRHFYEGGASIALTLATYRAIGGAPIVAHGEDKALFDAVRRNGGRVRHATDVRAATSCRLQGRAENGAADAIAIWGRQSDTEPIHETHSIDTVLGLADAQSGALTFGQLPSEIERARGMVAAIRARPTLAEIA